MTTKQVAEKWGISVRQVQNHCKNGRIAGIQNVGTNYLIPVDAVKPKYMYTKQMVRMKTDRSGTYVYGEAETTEIAEGLHKARAGTTDLIPEE